MKRIPKLILSGLAAVLFATGCRGLATSGEKSARQDLAEVNRRLQTNLPALTTNATLQDAVYFAVQNNPQVIGAYADWAASVENITVARSLPDPKLTFQAYIQDSLTSLRPGLAQNIPGYGKRDVRATAVQQTALDLQKSYYPLHFLNAKLNVNRQTQALLAELEALTRAQIEQKPLQTETANLEDSRSVMLAQFKAALGLRPEHVDPPVPAEPDFTGNRLDDERSLLNFQLDKIAVQTQREIARAELVLVVARVRPETRRS